MRSRRPGTAGGRAVGAQAPVDDLGLVDREAAVVGSSQAGRLADRAVDVSDGTARPAHDVVMIVPDAPLEPGRAPGRLDAAQESRRGERMEGVIHRLQGDMADAVTCPGGDRLDAKVITVPDGLEHGGAGCRHPQAGTPQLLGGGRGGGHGPNLPAQTRTIQDNELIKSRATTPGPPAAALAMPGRPADVPVRRRAGPADDERHLRARAARAARLAPRGLLPVLLR